MLLNSFFEIRQVEENGNMVRFTVSIYSGHEIFKGHFPQQPVVPGVFALQIIKECLEYAHKRKYRYYELMNCKFSNPIFPEQAGDILIECECEIAGSFLLKATVRSEDTVYITLKTKLDEI